MSTITIYEEIILEEPENDMEVHEATYVAEVLSPGTMGHATRSHGPQGHVIWMGNISADERIFLREQNKS